MERFDSRKTIEEGILSRIKEYLSSKIQKVISALGFGASEKISLDVMMTEAKKKTKGGNGFVAEYVCAHDLAVKLDGVGLKVNNDIGALKSIMDKKIKQFKKLKLSEEEIQRAINQGSAIADSIFDSIVNDGKDLIFVDYEFKYKEHEYEIRTTGSDTGKVTADDIEIVVRKKSETLVEKKILASLKAYKGSTTSLGSNSSIASLHKMFTGQSKRNASTDALFVKFFGPLGKEMLDAMQEYNDEASKFMKGNSKTAKGLRAYWDAKGKKPSKKTGLYSNNLRAQEVGDNFTKKKGYKQEHRLAELFVKLFKKGKTKLKKNGKEDQFRKGIMEILGVDDSVVTYNAIAGDDGVVTEVVNSNTSDAYRKLYLAIMDGADVELSTYKMKERGGHKGIGIKVDVTYKRQKIKGLSMSMWKDGTFQFKFDSKAK